MSDPRLMLTLCFKAFPLMSSLPSFLHVVGLLLRQEVGLQEAESCFSGMFHLSLVRDSQQACYHETNQINL